MASTAAGKIFQSLNNSFIPTPMHSANMYEATYQAVGWRGRAEARCSGVSCVPAALPRALQVGASFSRLLQVRKSPRGEVRLASQAFSCPGGRAPHGLASELSSFQALDYTSQLWKTFALKHVSFRWGERGSHELKGSHV